MGRRMLTSTSTRGKNSARRQISVLPSLAGLIALSMMATGISAPARGDAPEKWRSAAIQIVGAYEGKGYSQVTADTDCQGLSLGIEQHTVQSGSLLSIVNLMTTSDFDATVQQYLVTSQSVFVEIVELLRAGEPSKARIKSLELQTVETSGKCEGGRQGTAVKSSVQRELEAWLSSPKVRAAQIKAANEKLDLSFKLTECFLRDTGEQSPLSFGEFLFIYGWVVQGGSGSLRDKSLQRATARVTDYKDYATTREENIRRKVNYLSDWLAARWTDTARDGYFSDANKTSVHLRNLSHVMSPADVHLLYMRQVRASIGNTPYQLTFMNRGVIDLTGQGWVNGTSFDHRNTFTQMGFAPTEDRARVTCNND